MVQIFLEISTNFNKNNNIQQTRLKEGEDREDREDR